MSDRLPAASVLPGWFDPDLPPLHDDLSVRVVLPPSEENWQAATYPGLEMRLLEYSSGAAPRVSVQLRLAAGTESASLGASGDLELLVERGEIDCTAGADTDVWPARLYARLPVERDEGACTATLSLRAEDDAAAEGRRGPDAALVYLATGHIAPSDTERRRIDTTDPSRWLPGPVVGTEVMPLHGHGTSNVMMIRWLGAIAFRPRLDPLGEEVLVVAGCLHDADGDYPAGTWIRNPVPAWQSWSGDPGTLVYYKSGHFASAPDEESVPAATGSGGATAPGAGDADADADGAGADDA